MKQALLIATLVALFSFVGCKKDEAPTAPGTTAPPTFSTPQISNFGGPAPTNVLAAIRTVSSLAVPVIGTQYIDVNTGVAVFGSPGTDKGDVKIVYSGSDYVFTKQTNNGAVTYSYVPSVTSPNGIPFGSGASSVTFAAANYALSPNSVTVPGQIRLTAPADSVVSKSANVVLSWTMSGAAGAKTAVYITDAAGHFKFYENLGAITTYTIPAADMASFATGYGFVGVVTYNFVLANSNQAVLIGEAVGTKLLTINN